MGASCTEGHIASMENARTKLPEAELHDLYFELSL